MSEKVRLDKWLWAARFFKTRALATEAVSGGKVHVDGQRVKPAKDLRVGSRVTVTKGPYEYELVVLGLSDRRGPATEAQQLYEETEASREQREQVRAQQRAAALSMPRTDGRPGKRDRRRLSDFKRSGD